MKLAFMGDIHIGIFHEFSTTEQVYWNTISNKYEKWGESFWYEGKLNPFPEDNARCLALNSRLITTINCLADARDRLKKQCYLTVLICGDLFHNRGKLDVNVMIAVTNLLKSFKEQGFNLIAIAGNHDQTDNTIYGTSSLSIFREYMTVIETPCITEIYDGDEDYPLVCIPYCKDKAKVLEWITKAPDGAIVMAHLGVNGATSFYGELGGEFDLKELQPKKFKLIALGHYHTPQLLCKNTIYCGATVQQSFNDELKEGQVNGIMLYDSENCKDGLFTILEVYCPRFITVDDPNKVLSDKHYYRVKTTKTIDELQPFINQKLPNVRIEQEKEYSIEVESSISITNSAQEAIRIWAKENDLSTKVGEFIYMNKDADPTKVGSV